MPTETKAEAKEINAKVDLVKVSKDVVEHLTEVVGDVNAYVLPAQGQASLAEDAKTALDRMLRVSAQLENMPDSDFAMISEPAMTKKLEERKAREKVRAEREKEREKERLEKEKAGATGATGATGMTGGHRDAQGHQSRQHV